MTEDEIVALILHFRTPERTLACMQALFDEGVRHVVVVDNSEDGGASIRAMTSRLEELRTSGFDIVIVRQGRNLGFSAGVAAGVRYIESAQPAHVLLINSDAALVHGSVDQMRELLERAGIVVPAISQGGRPSTSSFAYYDRLLALITNDPVLTPVRHPSGCCLLIRSDRVNATLFDTDFFFYGEDVEFGHQAGLQGVVVAECPGAVVVHGGSVSAKDGSIFYEYHMNRAHWLLSRKLARNRIEFFAFVIARCFILPMRSIVRSLRFRSWNAWKGLIAATYDVLRGRCRDLTPPVHVHSESSFERER
jgi:GT2 family glycosyltransferase